MTISKHYDELYSKEVPFSMTPDSVVRDIPDPISGIAFELGAGQGRNSFSLAKRGLDVYAEDISPKAVEMINNTAKLEKLSVQAAVGDMTKIVWERSYDVIVTTFTMHHILRSDAVRVLSEIQEHTKPGGYNAIAQFTQDGDFYRNDPNSIRFYAALGEMRDVYSGWEILSYSEAESRAHQKREDGTNMNNVVARILARKPN